MAVPPRTVALAFHEERLGGASLAILRVMPLLEERGWSFACWTPGPGALRAELQQRGYTVGGEPKLLRFSARSLRAAPGPWARLSSLPGYLAAFRAWLSAQSPALLHANTWLTVPEAISARGTGIPALQYVHETVPSGLRGAGASALLRLGTPWVVGISDDNVRMLRRYGLRARLIYNGVPEAASDRPRERGRPLVIGTLGTIASRKGSDLFVQAAASLKDALPGAEFRLVGPLVEGPERQWSEAVAGQAEQLGIRWGPTDEPQAELAEWDLAVVPSRDEPFGLAAAEAMAAGLPVIAARVGGLPEVVGSNAGVLVPPEDPDALANAIRRLAMDSSARERMGDAGRRRVQRLFSLEGQADAIGQTYEAILAAGRPRRHPR